jgi:hypothetical protein
MHWLLLFLIAKFFDKDKIIMSKIKKVAIENVKLWTLISYIFKS